MRTASRQAGLSVPEMLLFLALGSLLALTMTTLMVDALGKLTGAAERVRKEAQLAALRSELCHAWENRARFHRTDLYRLEGVAWEVGGDHMLKLLQFPYFSEAELSLLRLQLGSGGWQLSMESLEEGVGWRRARTIKGIGRIVWSPLNPGTEPGPFPESIFLRFPDLLALPHETFALL